MSPSTSDLKAGPDYSVVELSQSKYVTGHFNYFKRALDSPINLNLRNESFNLCCQVRDCLLMLVIVILYLRLIVLLGIDAVLYDLAKLLLIF